MLVRGQHPRGGPATIDPQLAAGALDQGVGARLGNPHQRPDFLGQPVFGHQAQGLAFPLGQQFDGRGGGRRPIHDLQNRSSRTPCAPRGCKNALQPTKAKPISWHDHFCVGRALNTPTAPDPIDVAVGTRIRVQRRHLKISQDDLAQVLGLTFQQVQKYERGTNRVSASMLVRIAARLQTTVGSLVGEDVVAEQDVAMLTALSTPGAIDLLRAYGLATPKARKAILNVAKTLVEPDETADVA
jgi:transcriptional regulator with XRE-family HTH domain